jgi:hypothetical protein
MSSHAVSFAQQPAPDGAPLVRARARRRRVPMLVATGVVAAVACFAWSLWRPITAGNGADNLHVQQAQALLRGRLAIDQPLFDCVTFRGRVYVPFPPMPAVLMMPSVALVGVRRSNGPLLALALTLLNVVVAYRLAGRLGLAPRDRVWLLAAFFLGTGYWIAVAWSTGVWFWAHVVAVTFLLLAVAEAWGRGRGHLVGLALAAAFLSRQLTLLAAIALAWRLWSHPRFAGAAAARWRHLGAFAAALAAGVAAYLAFNAARFGNPFDTGYGHLAPIGYLKERFARHGLFSAAYVPFNLMYLLLQGFHVDFTSPARLSGLGIDGFGASLPGASPFVVLALFARRAQAPVRALWASIAATAAGHLLYFNNGADQHNAQRFTLDFMPLLFVLMAAGLSRESAGGRARLWRGAIVYAVLLNALCLTWLPALEIAFRALER